MNKQHKDKTFEEIQAPSADHVASHGLTVSETGQKV